MFTANDECQSLKWFKPSIVHPICRAIFLTEKIFHVHGMILAYPAIQSSITERAPITPHIPHPQQTGSLHFPNHFC